LNIEQGALDFDVSQEPATFGNVVNALWSLPVDLGNELLDDPPEGVPDDVFLEDTNEDKQLVDDEESVDLLAETPVLPTKQYTTKRAWTYKYKLRAVIDTFYVLKDDLAGQRKYKVPAYQLRRWQTKIEQLDIDRVDFGVGRTFQSGLERKVLAKKKIGCGRSGNHLVQAHQELTEWYESRLVSRPVKSSTAPSLHASFSRSCIPVLNQPMRNWRSTSFESTIGARNVVS
jgi:hypothetical protein